MWLTYILERFSFFINILLLLQLTLPNINLLLKFLSWFVQDRYAVRCWTREITGALQCSVVRLQLWRRHDWRTRLPWNKRAKQSRTKKKSSETLKRPWPLRNPFKAESWAWRRWMLSDRCTFIPRSRGTSCPHLKLLGPPVFQSCIPDTRCLVAGYCCCVLQCFR